MEGPYSAFNLFLKLIIQISIILYYFFIYGVSTPVDFFTIIEILLRDNCPNPYSKS